MGMRDTFFGRIDSIVPEVKGALQETTVEQNRAGSSKEDPSSTTNVAYAQKITEDPDSMFAFSGETKNYCIGLVDMVDSTKISANLHEKDWCKYYSIFLNSMGKIVKRFGGIIIKNGGDSLLYYFPESSNSKRKYGFMSCLECSLALVEAQKYICKNVLLEGLPALNYRVSADYGNVVIMMPDNSRCIDVIGPPVNMCSKINHKAEKNSVVIGGDLYQMVKDYNDYNFKSVSEMSIGLKYTYPIYAIQRKGV